MNKGITLFIVEGVDRDDRFVKEMSKCFFKGSKRIETIRVPADQNIYMLYQKLAEDDFETDIVEVLRENIPQARERLSGIMRQNIGEVYLFFDYEIQQNNVPNSVLSSEILQKMLDTFNNETESGKLYISYPMVEALYDYKGKDCEAFSNCYLALSNIGDYKRLSGENNPKSSLRNDIKVWKEVLETFILRIECLLGVKEIAFREYRQNITPATIFKLESILADVYGRVFVLSALPEFLLDYFPESFWNAMIHRKNKKMATGLCSSRLYAIDDKTLA